MLQVFFQTYYPNIDIIHYNLHILLKTISCNSIQPQLLHFIIDHLIYSDFQFFLILAIKLHNLLLLQLLNVMVNINHCLILNNNVSLIFLTLLYFNSIQQYEPNYTHLNQLLYLYYISSINNHIFSDFLSVLITSKEVIILFHYLHYLIYIFLTQPVL